MKYIFLSVFFSVSVFAAEPMPQHYAPWPYTGTLYLIQSLCPKTCYPIVENGVMKDPSVSDLIDGKIVENAAKKAAKAVKEQASKDSADKRTQEIGNRKEIVNSLKGKSLSSDELKQAVEALLELAGDK